VRSEGQFNTIIYSEEDVYRKQSRRDVLLMHPIDMESLGLQEGLKVDVANSTGRMKGLTLARFDIKPGNVMTYFPEANVLIPQTIDDRSRTPTFKNVVVEVTAHQPECVDA
jgi:anaerobic selenocysteine-containing dehydrogenase